MIGEQKKHSLKFHSGQRDVWRSKARFKCIVAGRRWGKTRYSLTELIVKGAKKKRQQLWYVAPTYTMAKQILWPDLLESVPRKWVKEINKTALTVVLRNKSTIILKGADKYDTLRGVGLHHCVLDEFQDMDPDTWIKAIRPTLATTMGTATFIGTPKSFNHLYEVYQLGQKPDMVQQRRYQSWQFASIDSPFVPPEEVEMARQDMDPRSFEQEFNAKFNSMGGRVYYPFDREAHVGDFPFNPDLPIWLGQDFNRDPMAGAIMQPQPNGEVWIVDEIVLPNSNTEEAVNELERRYWRHQKTTSIFPDPAGSYSQHARGESDLDIFREKSYKRIYYRKKHPKVADRINAVNRMLMSAKGDILLRVNNKCQNVIESFEQTVYKEGSRDVNKDLSVEHVTDAIGYCIEYRYPSKKIVIAGVSL